VLGELKARESRENSMQRPDKKAEEIAAREAAAFLKRASITYLECCISLMMTHLPREDVAAILEREAEMLRELD
jgi:hypothetical protein